MALQATTGVITSPFRGSRVRDAVLVVAGALFIALSAQVAIPLPFTPVPLTGQTLAVLLTGAALGSSLGLATTGLYLALALIGFPVLAATSTGSHLTGAAVLSSPTLGYVLGFMLSAVVVGALANRGLSRTPMGMALAMIAGNLAIYALGLLWLHHAISVSWSQTVALGLTPFLIGDAIKIIIAAGLLPSAWRFLR
ncbi:MAG: biotin transporter BioY [Candidatus Nanopelagicales bacterium]